MDKKRLFKIMTKADPAVIAALAETIQNTYDITVVKEPSKTLAMVRLRESVKSSLFYIGEVIVTEAVVELEGARGIAVSMGDNFDKTLHMAMIDAACNKGVFTDDGVLFDLERTQTELERKENAMHLRTMVSFASMDATAPSDGKEAQA
jgi:alpha-D-ribose 1-methylphosphonate 5-triphosphate synthase subunit PhnG